MDYIEQADLEFLVFDWLKSHELTARPDYRDHDRETLQSVIDLSANLARDTFAQHFKISDTQEPRLENGKVVLPRETEEDLIAFRDAGFFAAGFPEENGGMPLPTSVALAVQANFMAANTSTAAYPFLTAGNANLLLTFGTPAQIKTWVEPAIAGRYFGTMCLSEPQAGSSLGDIRTRADFEEKDELGPRYRLRGNKMWISGGAHEMGENIVHLVLAKVPNENGDLTAGVRGISIFAVPKILPDGTINDIAVAGLNHKMGYRGTSNCLLNFGENDGAVGWRVGEVGQGLGIMFQMMNEARIGVGLGAACMAYRGYVQSLAYAKGRLQGRISGDKKKGADTPQTAIIEHVDVKRMLLTQKAYSEGGMALALYSARVSDDAHTHPDEETRMQSAELLDLLTPVSKSWPSEFGLISNDLAIQVHGGYGYTRDFDVEQLYRDNRLNPIHEGTFGIQAADLLGRKIGQNSGAGLKLLMDRIEATILLAKSHDDLARDIEHLEATIASMQNAISEVLSLGKDPSALDNAGAFLSGFGHVIVAWLWISQVLSLAEASRLKPGKLAACRYFLRVELPRARTNFQLVASKEDCISKLDSAFL